MTTEPAAHPLASVSPRLAQIWCYPLKSARGVQLEVAELDGFGVRWDRRWMLVDEVGRFLTQREHPMLVKIQPRIGAGSLQLSAPGMPLLTTPLRPSTAERVEVTVWRDRCLAVPHPPEVDEWFSSFLGIGCRLVFMPPDVVRSARRSAPESPQRTSFTDGYPLHLLSFASVAALNDRLDEPVSVERFRPNLVVEGTEPHAEDQWTMVRVGSVELRSLGPCMRCAVTTVNPATGEKGKEPLRTLATYRTGNDGVEFGRYFARRGEGTLRVGARIDAE